MTYRIYLRVSTESQAERGHGINSQRDGCIAFCKDSPYEVYADEGVSGGTHIAERPGMLDLMREFKRGDVLLVAQRDRLGRDPIIVAVLEKTVEERGGTVVSVAGEGTGSDNPSDILIRRVVDAISEYVRLNGKLRVKMALKAKKDRGERTGGIPYGYRLDEDGVHLVKDHLEQIIIYLAKERRKCGDSYATICGYLTKLGYFPRKGNQDKPFLPEQIRRMVKP